MDGYEIAIVGMAGRFPGAPDVDAFWRNVREGRYALEPTEVEDIDGRHAQGHWVRTNCLLPDAGHFDPGFFSLNPREAAQTDPQHRLFLEAAWRALEDAGVPVGSGPQSVGVYAGASFSCYFQMDDYEHLLDALPGMIGADKDYLATRISHRLNLTGPSMTVQSACSTSLVAVHLACQALLAGECDAAVAGGVSISTPRDTTHFYMPGGILSADGRCRAFDANANGTVFAEGVGAVVLRRLEDALRDRDNIYAVILGSAVNNDASRKTGYSAPSIEGQVQVVRQAYAAAGVRASDIGYVEAHGTGTVVGDAVELAALSRVFASDGAERGGCYLGSVKTNVGHLASAAGVAGLIKAALAVRDGFIPANVNFDTPNPDLDPAGPFRVPSAPVDWKDAAPRRAGISSFGVGGTNAHIVVQQPPPVEAAPDRRAQILVLSAKSEAALDRSAAQLAEHLRAHPDLDAADVAYTCAVGRGGFAHRRAVVCSDAAEAVEVIERRNGQRMVSGRARNAPKVAFMFPGQGAQHPGMAASLYRAQPVFREAFDECLGLLRPHLETDIADLLLAENPDQAGADLLQQTACAQPALFLMEHSLRRLIESWGVVSAVNIGHSIGEFAAACASGVLSLDAAAVLVARRGALMQTMPPGVMLSVSTDWDSLKGRLPEGVDLAAVNGPELCVLAGPSSEIDLAQAWLDGEGFASRRLHTSHAFHSRMMQPILEAFGQAAAGFEFRAPAAPLVSNVTGALMADAPTARYWIDHIRRPVLFAAGLGAVMDQDVEILLEVGPGRNLGALARQCGAERRGLRVVNAMADARDRQDEGLSFLRAMGALWVEGAPVDPATPFAAGQGRKVPLPAHPLDRRACGFGPWGEEGRPRRRPGDRQAVEDWTYRPSWKRGAMIASGAPERLRARLLFGLEACGLSRRLDRKWRADGCRVVSVLPGEEFHRRGEDLFEIDPANDEHYQRLAAELGPIDQVVHLWTLEDASSNGALIDHDRGLFSLLRCLNALRLGEGKPTVHIVTRGACDVLGKERLFPPNAALASFATVVPQEQPGTFCRLIDLSAEEIDGDPGLAERVDREIAGETADLVVALRGPHRWVRVFEPVAITLGDAPLRQGGAYLIVGGLGDLGLTFARWLARECGAGLLLTSRAPFPEPAAWDAALRAPETPETLKDKIRALREIEALGGSVRVIRSDAADPDDAMALRREAEALGLNGLIYAAGNMSLSSTLTSPVDVADYRAHLAAKAVGVAVLDAAFEGLDLDFRTLLSSISTVLGGLGHCGYSAANQVADTLLADRDRTRAGRWHVIGWDLWRSRKVLDSHAGAAVRLAIKEEEGMDVFAALLRQPPGQAIVSTTRLEKRLSDWVRTRPEKTVAAPKPEGVGDGALETQCDWTGPVEQALGGIWQTALGVDAIGRDQDFFDLGGHSLLAVQIAGRVREAFGVVVPLEQVFTARTIRDMAAAIEERLPKGGAAPAAPELLAS